MHLDILVVRDQLDPSVRLDPLDLKENRVLLDTQDLLDLQDLSALLESLTKPPCMNPLQRYTILRQRNNKITIYGFRLYPATENSHFARLGNYVLKKW